MVVHLEISYCVGNLPYVSCPEILVPINIQHILPGSFQYSNTSGVALPSCGFCHCGQLPYAPVLGWCWQDVYLWPIWLMIWLFRHSCPTKLSTDFQNTIFNHWLSLYVWLVCFTICPFWRLEKSSGNLFLWQDVIISSTASLSSSTERETWKQHSALSPEYPFRFLSLDHEWASNALTSFLFLQRLKSRFLNDPTHLSFQIIAGWGRIGHYVSLCGTNSISHDACFNLRINLFWSFSHL